MENVNLDEHGEIETRATFSISDEDLTYCPNQAEEKKQKDSEPAKNKSRFKVNRVEFVNETKNQGQPDHGEMSRVAVELVEGPQSADHAGQTATGSSLASGDGKAASTSPPQPVAALPRTRQKQDSVSSDSPAWSPNPTDSYQYSYDTNNLKTFGHNTLETLPHLDHYRNLLSATGAMRKRPTLLELHEHDKVR